MATPLPTSSQATTLPLEALQLPEAISWWPLAPGWWVLIGLVLVLVIVITAVVIRHWYQHRSKRATRRVLQDAYRQYQQSNNYQQFLQVINQTLKRYCREQAPSASGLSGQAWIDFLNHSAGCKHAGGRALFQGDCAHALAMQVYQAKPEAVVKPERILRLCTTWLSAHKPESE